jgi:hypothetical protein
VVCSEASLVHGALLGWSRSSAISRASSRTRRRPSTAAEAAELAEAKAEPERLRATVPYLAGYASSAAESAAQAAGRPDAAYMHRVAALAAWQASGGRLRKISGARGTELVAGGRYTRPSELVGGPWRPRLGAARRALQAWLSAHSLSTSATTAGAPTVRGLTVIGANSAASPQL